MKNAVAALALLTAACGTAAPSPPLTPIAPDAPANPVPPGPDPLPMVSYATQLTAPSPAYQKEAPLFPPAAEMVREASARAPADAKAIGELWRARLEARGVLQGYGLSGKRETDPISMFDVGMTRSDFDAWIAANGWDAPRHIRWSFAHPLTHPAADPAALARVRVWPVSAQRTGAQNQALMRGRIYVEDGCFFLDRGANDGYGPAGRYLVQFGHETGLGIDAEGYLMLYDRFGGRREARLGEMMHWSGPNGAPSETAPEVVALRQACGSDPVEFVGNVVAAEKFYAAYPHTRPK